MEGNGKRIISIIVILLSLVLAVLIYLKLTASDEHHFEVIYFNVGQGDSALIKFANGQRMLVDCGPDKKVLSKLGQYLPFFDRRLDYLLVTHPDSDHYAGCPAVLQRYDVKNIFINGAQKPGDPFWEAWKKYRMLEGAHEQVIGGGERLKIGDSELIFLSPDSGLKMNDVAPDDTNNYSIVFLLKNNFGRFLFTGDMETALEDALLQKYCPTTSAPCAAIQADYLKVGHHGSNSSSGVEFLKAVAPKYAIVSVGPPPNRYGHPSMRILRKLEREGAAIWRTDLLDDIIVQ